LDEYFNDNRFGCKKPNIGSSDEINGCGDNIYYIQEGKYRQLENIHHDEGDIEHDTSGENVLISNNFYYFWKSAVHHEILSSMNISEPSGQSRYGVKSSEQFRNSLNEILKSKGWQQKSERSYWNYIRTVKTDQL